MLGQQSSMAEITGKINTNHSKQEQVHQTKGHQSTSLMKASPSLSNVPRTPTSASSSKPVLKDSPQTPKSSKSRSCWMFQTYKMGNSYSIEISVRNHAGKIGPLSVCKPAARYRPSFGSIAKFESSTAVDKKTGEHTETFIVINEDNVKHRFRQDLLYIFLKSTNPFTQMCQGLIQDGKWKLLSLYLTQCAQSKEFTMFRQDIHTEEGLMKEGNLVAVHDLTKAGGSIVELKQFILLAKNCAIVIGGQDDSQGSTPTIRQKRINEYYLASAPAKKMNKADQVEHNYRQECENVNGLEQKLTSSFSGFRKISLDNLSVSDKLSIPFNEAEVVPLAEDMHDRFNPALCVLTVTGEDETFSEDNKYSVVEGVHRLKALQLLDSQGRLLQVPGIEDRKIECFVLTSTGDPAIDNYCNIHSNDQARQYQSKSSLHELIYVYSFLSKAYADAKKALEAVEKMSKLRHIGADDLTSLKKISSWPELAIDHLIEVLKKYERYQTTGKIFSCKILSDENNSFIFRCHRSRE